jgi:Leucine-rich repeat (LRR) protein
MSDTLNGRTTVTLPVLEKLFTSFNFKDQFSVGLSTLANRQLDLAARINIKQLDLMNLNMNSIPDFKRFNTLLRLDLRHNSLVRLKKNSFEGLCSLQILILEHSNIHEIECGAFDRLTRLLSLDLCFNPICSTMCSTEFQSKYNLKHLADLRFWGDLDYS